MFGPSLEYYEKMKGLQEKLARLERERIEIEKKGSVYRSSIANSSAAIERRARLEDNMKNARTKIEENRDIMRRVNQNIMRLDSALETLDHLDSLRQNYAKFAREEYERWRDEDPERAARYWREKGSKNRENDMKTEDVEVEASVRPTKNEAVVQLAAEPKVNVITVSDGKVSSANDQSSEESQDVHEAISPELLRSPEVEREPGKISAGDEIKSETSKTSQLSTQNRFPSRESKATNQPKSQNVNDDSGVAVNVANSSQKRATIDQGPSSGFFYQDESISPEASSQDISQTNAKLSKAESFDEKRELDQKNEFPRNNLDTVEGSDASINMREVKPVSGSNHAINNGLSIKGLSSLLTNIEKAVKEHQIDAIYKPDPLLFYNSSEIIALANRGEVNSSSVISADVVIKNLPSLVNICQNGSLFPESLFVSNPRPSSLESARNRITEKDRELFDILVRHWKVLLAEDALSISSIAELFGPKLVGKKSKYRNESIVLLRTILEHHQSTDEPSESTTVSHFSLTSPRVKQTTGSAPDKKSVIPESSNQNDDLSDDDSFPFTSQSIDDHLGLSGGIGASAKGAAGTNAYQSWLQNIGATSKAAEGENESDDDIELPSYSITGSKKQPPLSPKQSQELSDREAVKSPTFNMQKVEEDVNSASIVSSTKTPPKNASSSDIAASLKTSLKPSQGMMKSSIIFDSDIDSDNDEPAPNKQPQDDEDSDSDFFG